MKKRQLSARSDPPKPVQVAMPTHEEQDQQPKPKSSPNLSPQRVTEGATSKTEIINKILQQDTGLGYLRHWGLND
jgi:hypothetical protein